MAVDFGTDWDVVTDLGARLTTASGIRNLGNALARRLTSPRGCLSYDLNYGYDIRLLLSAALTPAQVSAVQGAIERECEKDDRVRSCSAVLTHIPQAQSLTIVLSIETAAGPFSLVLGVDKVTVTVLGASQ